MYVMNKLSKITNIALASVMSAGIANAFGYFKGYGMYDMMGRRSYGLFAGFGIVVLIAILFLFVFWLWMLVDCLKRDFKKDYDKIVWVLVLIFLHILGAIVYYFIVKTAGAKKIEKKK